MPRKNSIRKSTIKKKRGRSFEELIAIIESHSTPLGAVVKSPDKIVDKTTGQLREVDATIRHKIGSASILIAIECRDRSRIEDCIWIEQLAQKKEAIGANVMIAVSSRAFSKPALRKAKEYNIEIRVLRDISEKALENWASKISMIIMRGQFRFGIMKVTFRGMEGKPSPKLTGSILEGYSKGDANYKFVKRLSDGELLSIGDLLNSIPHPPSPTKGSLEKIVLPPQSVTQIPISEKYSQLFEDIPIGGDPVKRDFVAEFREGIVTIDTEEGPLDVQKLEIELFVFQTIEHVNEGQMLSYENEDTQFAKVNVRKIIINGKESRIIIT
ncbi:MAG: hypothetical protein EHM20_06585 [Alphaproteobacteria bacterium]|nr:MAG: hypothetical protein EHM20_06585 [Alphaproteobacteria bacterium]